MSIKPAKKSPAKTESEFQEQLRDINEELMISSVRQHELTEVAETARDAAEALTAELQERETQLRDINEELVISSARQRELTEVAETARDAAEGLTAELRTRETQLAESQMRLAMELSATQQLQEISTRLIGEDRPEVLYEQILDAVVMVMRSQYASIQLLVPERGDGGELWLMGYRGFSPEAAKFWEWVRPASESTCGVALRTGERVVVPNVEACEWMAGSDDLAMYLETGIRAVQTTPLISRSGRLVGMISTHWALPHEPADRDFHLLDVLARQAADLIERTQVEQALKESEEQYRTLFDSAPMAVFVCDRNAVIQHYNSRAVELWGREPECGVEQHCGSVRLWLPDGTLLPHAESPMLEVLRTGVPARNIEVFIERPDGSRLPVLVNFAVLKNAREEITGAITSFMDITDRKRSEEKLWKSEQRFARFMHHLPGLAWIKDGEGRYLYANDAAEKAFGVERDNLYGKTDAEVFPPETAAAFARNDKAALAAESGVQVVEALEVGPGEVIESLVSKFAIAGDKEQEPLVGGMAIDITDRRQIQRDQEFLFTIAEKIRTSSSAAGLLTEISQAVGSYLNVHRCLFNEIDLEADTETVHSDFSRTGESVAGVHRISEYSSVMSEIMKSGKTVVNRDSRLDPRTAEFYAKTYRPNKERAYVAVPMLREGKWVASLWCSDDKPRNWADREIALLEGIAERTWAAVERLRADQALRESEERFQLAQSAGSVGVWDWDLVANRTYWSDTMWRFYGEVERSVNPDDEFWSAHLHPDDRDRVKENLERTVTSSDRQYKDEFRIIGAEGRTIWIDSMANVVRDPDGKAVRIYGVNLDITERKLNEERIKRNETQLRLVTDSLPALIAYVDRKRRYQFANKTYFDWFGLEPAEVVGKTLKEVLGAKAYDNLEPFIEKALAGEHVSVHTEIDYKKAGKRFIHLNYAPDVAEDGTVRGYFSLINDLTEMKRAEDLLRSTEERIALLMENVADYAIFSINTEGLIESWNTGAEMIFGYSADEILGRPGDILFTPDDVARGVHTNEMRVARQRGRSTDERWLVKKDGTRFFANGVMMPLIVGKRLTGYAKIASDLTERKRRAEALQSAHDELELRVFQRTRELAETNELLRREAEQRKLSEKHRVTLLHRIVAAQEAERQRIARDIHDQFGQRLTALRLKLASLHDICMDNDVVAGRIETLQEIATLLDSEVSFMASELRPSILDDLGLEEALRAYSREWSSHFDIELEFHSNGLIGKRYGSEAETQIYRIAQEALNNIAKHAGSAAVTVLMEQTADFLVLIIEDTGMGFDVANAPLRSKSGLGLVGMKERATLIGGDLEIESEPGQGTTIFLRLPHRKRGQTNGR